MVHLLLAEGELGGDEVGLGGLEVPDPGGVDVVGARAVVGEEDAGLVQDGHVVSPVAVVGGVEGLAVLLGGLVRELVELVQHPLDAPEGRAGLDEGGLGGVAGAEVGDGGSRRAL